MNLINLEAKRIADELDAAMRAYQPDPSRRAGITQRQLAMLSGVPQPTISRTLKALSTPETETLAKLSRALGRQIGGYRATAGANTMAIEDSTPIDDCVALLREMSQAGRYVALGALQEIHRRYPAAKPNHSS